MKYLAPCRRSKGWSIRGRRYRFVRVMVFGALESVHIRSEPQFFLSNRVEAPYGDSLSRIHRTRVVEPTQVCPPTWFIRVQSFPRGIFQDSILSLRPPQVLRITEDLDVWTVHLLEAGQEDLLFLTERLCDLSAVKMCWSRPSRACRMLLARTQRKETLPCFHGHRGSTEVHDHVEFCQGSITNDRPECIVQVDHAERQRCIPPLNSPSVGRCR